MKKIKVGVIPAAGKGNRIKELPLTKILPKPMLPVLNKPILEYVVEKMRDVGIETIYIIVGPKKELKDIGGNIPDLRNPPPGCNFHPRCPNVMDICRTEEPPNFATKDGFVACWLYEGKMERT